MKTCLIRQPAGIGDIMYCQKIAFHYQGLGYKIVWPVAHVFPYIKNYLPNFNFIDETNDFEFKNLFLDMNVKEIVETDGNIFIPLNGHNLRNKSVMASKYNLVGLPFHDWKDYLFIKRNLDRENNLYYNILGLKDGEEYRLINYMFATQPHTLRMKRLKLSPMKEVEVSFIKDDTAFDWIKVIENATEVCMTDSSFALFVEYYNKKARDLICLLRGQTTVDVESMYQLPWRYTRGVWE